MQTVHVFDLDQTVIDSSKRVLPLLDSNGDLDLNRYKAEACKHELIQGDELLPLASYMRQLLAEGAKVVICTARFMSKSDYIFLRRNGLRAPLVLSRDQLHKHFPSDKVIDIYNSGDGSYKGAYFDVLRARFNNAQFVVYDDHQGVLAAAQDRGFTTIDAIHINKLLTEQYIAGYEDGEQDGYTEGESIAHDIAYAN